MLDFGVLSRSIAGVLGESEWPSLATSLASPASPGIRLRPKVDPQDLPFPVTPIPWHPQGFVVAKGIRAASFPAYGAGEYYIQDVASLLAVRLLEVAATDWVCDLCAAPGGKATAILEQLTAGWLLANEPVRSRQAALRLNLARHGSSRYVISQLDPALLAERIGDVCDAVLVDAPCSGQSLVRRGKQSPAAFQDRQVEHCAARQSRILQAAARLVRPGGRLVYSTCTFAVAENEAQITAFLTAQPDWSIEAEPALQAWQSPLLPGSYRLWPHRDAGLGGFAVRLQRNAATPPSPRSLTEVRDSLPKEFAHWGHLNHLAAVQVRAQDHLVFAWPDRLPETWAAVIEAGPEVAHQKGKTWFPAYAAAMNRDGLFTPLQTVDLGEPEAALFLNGQPVNCRCQGWTVPRWEGRALGWLKANSRIGKNHLPKAARLRTLPSKSPA